MLWKRGLSFRTSAPDEVWAEIDLERIEQVLVNLIDNALKFSPAGSAVGLEVEDGGGEVLIAVADEGPGVPEEFLEDMFKKFHTLPSSGRGKAEGTGLGLAISKAVIEAHGGRIWAESWVGAGCVIRFRLPKKQAD